MFQIKKFAMFQTCLYTLHKRKHIYLVTFARFRMWIVNNG